VFTYNESTLQPATNLADNHPHPRMSGEDRRRQLIEVAIDLFSQRGFGGVTTREIAAAAGVTEAIIFRHFATKQDLYTAILDYKGTADGMAEWLVEAQASMDRNDDEGLFRLIITKIIDMHRAETKFERLMVHAALEGHELAVMHRDQINLTIHERLHDYIEQRKKAGALRNCNTSALLLSAVGPAMFYAMQKYIYQPCKEEFADDETMINAFVSNVMNGVRTV
jgi:TetR/AcrR family transcriptional regulator